MRRTPGHLSGPRPALRAGTVTAILAMAACCVAPPRQEQPAVRVPPEVAVAEFVELARSARRDAGCPDLTWDARAAGVAMAHSADMLRRGYFSHDSPEGVGPFERLRKAGVTFSAAAENIAYGAWTGAAAFQQWIRSPGHRRNLLNCRYTRHGVGVAGDRWTHILFAP